MTARSLANQIFGTDTHTHLSGVTKTPVAKHCALCLVSAVEGTIRGGGQDSSEVDRTECKGQKEEGTLDDRGRDGGTNFILRIKEQETRLTLQEHDDDDDDDDDEYKGK